MKDVALIFPGQGAQYVGMGKDFYERFPRAKEIFDQANNFITGLVEAVFYGPQEILTSTQFCQPAIFTFSLAAYEVFKKHPKFRNINVKYSFGLSLGEYSALCASGALSFAETIRLIERRAFFMDQACNETKGSMAAVIGFDKEKIEEVCRKHSIEVANYNSPEQIVITGEADKVEAASNELSSLGAKRVIPLDVAGGFHSRLMKNASLKFKAELDKVRLNKTIIPLIGNVDGLPKVEPADIKAELEKQITSSVQFVNSVEYVSAKGVKDFVEIGPGNVLKGLLRKINKDLNVCNIQKIDDLESLPF
ncbi:MAG: ACP S-malonyltransferase [Candidatus Omnitrophica bacterium]|nr:ACP S-malonyltransferase [Candidatus Omnitrophota bacterium]